MSAKEDIERLEQKVDILYNVIYFMMVRAGLNDLSEHFKDDIMTHVNVVELDADYIRELGRNN